MERPNLISPSNLPLVRMTFPTSEKALPGFAVSGGCLPKLQLFAQHDRSQHCENHRAIGLPGMYWIDQSGFVQDTQAASCLGLEKGRKKSKDSFSFFCVFSDGLQPTSDGAMGSNRIERSIQRTSVCHMGLLSRF